jgi:hypothetical protein
MPVPKSSTTMRNRNVIQPSRSSGGYDYKMDWVFSGELPVGKSSKRGKGKRAYKKRKSKWKD